MSSEVNVSSSSSSSPPPPSTPSAYLAAGAVAGLCVDVVLFPLDTIKTRMQSKQGFLASGGFKHIYAGIGSAAIGSAPSSAMFFATYELVKHHLLPLIPTHSQAVVHCTAAALGEIMACLVRVPTDNIKQKRQAGLFTSTAATFRHIHSHTGFTGFYTGYMSTIMREIPFSLIQFPLYEKMKQWRIQHKQQQSHTHVDSHSLASWEYAAMGSISGSVAAALTTPMDVVKTRLMLLSSDSHLPPPSVLSTLSAVYQEGGIARLFSGVGPRVLWIGLGGAVFLGGYETTKAAINVYSGHTQSTRRAAS